MDLTDSRTPGGEIKREKAAVRVRLLKERQGLTPDEIAAKSDAIRRRLGCLDVFLQAENVMLYSPVRGEVDTRGIVELAWAMGKTVLLPRAVRAERRIAPVVFLPGQALVRGEYGIPEPPQGSAGLGIQDLSMVCLPGVAFSLDGSRLGYGGGYYDRLLSDAAFRAATCGLAFDLQVLCVLPRDVFDGTVDVIVTESRTIRPAGNEYAPGP